MCHSSWLDDYSSSISKMPFTKSVSCEAPILVEAWPIAAFYVSVLSLISKGLAVPLLL